MIIILMVGWEADQIDTWINMYIHIMHLLRVYMCMRVCMYVFVCIYTQTLVHIYTYIHTHINIYTYHVYMSSKSYNTHDINDVIVLSVSQYKYFILILIIMTLDTMISWWLISQNWWMVKKCISRMHSFISVIKIYVIIVNILADLQILYHCTVDTYVLAHYIHIYSFCVCYTSLIQN